MHPAVLLFYLAGMMTITMITGNPILVTASLLAAAVVGSLLCGKQIWKSAFWLFIPVCVFMVGILPLFSHQGATPLFYINSRPVTMENMIYGLVMTEMLVAVFLWFQIAGVLLDSEKLLFLFGKAAPAAGLLTAMVFRMLPLLRKRFREIREAQRGLGFDGGQREYMKMCRQFGKEFSILVSWSLESAVETSVSMESRGYGACGRTSFHLFRFHKRDLAWSILFLLLFGINSYIIGKGGFSVQYFPVFNILECGMEQKIGFASLIAAGLLPVVFLCVKGKK
jgi:energy-coupling factor transport system permease protein